MKVSDTCYQIPGAKGGNCYLWLGREVTVIDTGLPGNEQRILKFVRSVAPGKSIKTIVLTHSDIDHIGSAVRLKGLTGAKIAIHADDAPAVEGKRVLKEGHYLLSGFVQFFSFVLGYRPFTPDLILKDKDRLDGLVVVHTPGHSKGSICLYKKGEIIFTGDAVITTPKGTLRKIRSFITQSVEKTKQSTRLISKLNFKILCPGHGPLILQDASQKVRKQAASL
jgi:glyoxylase-like metal-dependent hydrolase (beta-lactamase superfamily II)